MKTTMVIPTYWGREKSIGYKEGDATYDHPTPLDQEGTLRRAIESTHILRDRGFDLVIIGAATSPDIQLQAEQKIKSILHRIKTGSAILFFSHSELKKVVAFLNSQRGKEFAGLLELRGYSNVRNLCLAIPQLLSSDAAILIDDDEIFEDPDFMAKAREFLREDFNGEKIFAKAGYYLTPQGTYTISREILPWMAHWNKVGWMNQAFERFIGTQPRLKKTPFVFGGNMVICVHIVFWVMGLRPLGL